MNNRFSVNSTNYDYSLYYVISLVAARVLDIIEEDCIFYCKSLIWTIFRCFDMIEINRIIITYA
jgi:hypothetical protein